MWLGWVVGELTAHATHPASLPPYLLSSLSLSPSRSSLDVEEQYAKRGSQRIQRKEGDPTGLPSGGVPASIDRQTPPDLG